MTSAYRFGLFELQPNQRRLLLDGRPVELGHRAFDVLLALVERAGQLVTKEELLGLAWPGLVVEENNLQVQVSSLRKILGAAAITTVPGCGYRFMLQLTPGGELSSPPVALQHNLPPQLTSFVGHEEDLHEYAALLDQTRLLTLTGIGGCGKTRLAIKLAEQFLSSFPDGIWYVDLAPLLDADRISLTVATTLGIREENDRPIADTLCGRLAKQRMLLVLDNCEHLTPACAALITRMIAAAPGVRVLVGSREGLGVLGERAMTVRSLSFPPPGTKHERGALEACEAVQLFVERAQLSVPKFSLTDDTADAVAEICRRLDGIPLAVELAAARVKVLSVEEIRARLDDRFRLLRGGSKTASARQQTLLATIQWSYDHLSADEQQLLRRLSVFVGGWTLDGAARVAGEPLDEYAVLDLLARLVDQSLVTIQRGEGDATRYSMLETVRQYAQDRLNEAREDEAARNRHLEFYVALAEQAKPELVGREQSVWLARLDLDRENLLAAHAWCDQSEGGAELGLRLVSSLRVYVRDRGLLALGHRITLEALARPGAQGHNLARCRALSAAGDLCNVTGRYREARDYQEMSLTISREIRDEGRAAWAHVRLAYADLALGNRTTAHGHALEALALSRQLGDKRRLAHSLNVLAELHRVEEDLDEALPLYEETLALYRELGDHRGIASSLTNLARTSIGLGLGDRARGMVREALAIAHDTRSKGAGAWSLECSIGLAAFFREWECAARLYGATEALSEQTGYRREPVDEAFLAPLIARTREALGAEAFAAAEISGRALSYDEAIAETRAWLEQRS